MIYDLFISYCFLLSFLKLKFWGGLLDVYLVLEGKLEFPQFAFDIVPHRIDQEKLSDLLSNFFIVYCYEC